MSDNNLLAANKLINQADKEQNPYFSIEDMEKAIIYLKREIEIKKSEII